jgi:hypothetical protein
MPSVRRVRWDRGGVRNVRWLLALLLVVPGCGPGDGGLDRTSLGGVKHGRLVQVSDRYLLLESGQGHGATYELLERRPRTRETVRKPLRLPELAGCARTTYGLGFGFSPYELGVRRECHGADGTRDLDLVAYHMQHRRVRVVLAEPPPDADGYARHDQDVLAWFSERDCTWLKRYEPGKREPRPLDITLEGETWPLDAAPETPGDCRDHGMVLLPDGGYGLSLGIVASPAARGRTGADRWKARFTLYSFHMDGSRKIDDLAGRPRALVWSGIVRAVSVDGSNGGIYQVARDGRLHPLSERVASSLAAMNHSIYLVEDTDGDTDPVYSLGLPIE